MAGNNSVRGDETITFTDNMSFDGTERGGKMTTDGQLWIGSTASRHVKLGSLTSPNSTISIGYSSPNITLDVGSGNLVLIQSQTVSGASSVTFTSGISSTYDDYVIRIKGMSASSDTYLFGQFSTDSGATWINSAGYNNNGYYASGAGSSSFYASGQTQMRLGDNVPGSAGNQMGGVIEFFDISSGSFMPVCLSRLQAKGGIDVLNYYGNAYDATLAVNGIKIYPDAGTITGTFQLFGIVK